MAVVRRIFRMVGVENVSTHGAAKTLEREGVPNPGGGRYWYKRLVKRFILDDVYRPHTFQEVAALVAPEVVARLDPDGLYGVWWFNRRRTSTTQVAVAGPEGREYKRKNHVAYKDREEWIAVPVPGSGCRARGWMPRGPGSPGTAPRPSWAAGSGSSPAPSCAAGCAGAPWSPWTATTGPGPGRRGNLLLPLQGGQPPEGDLLQQQEHPLRQGTPRRLGPRLRLALRPRAAAGGPRRHDRGATRGFAWRP